MEKNSNNFLLYILLFLMLLCLGVFGVILTQYEILSKDEFKNKYVKKEHVTFDMLPSNIQSEYVHKSNVSSEIQIQEVEKIKVITETKEIEVPKYITQDIFSGEKYHVAKCYDMVVAKVRLSKKCEKDIEKFLNSHKDANYFEVIGIVSNQDISSLSASKYTKEGLAKKRVEETSWFIKKTLGMDIKVLPVNYHITSKKNNKGTVVRVYY
jgi:hypothetical protein